jgi:hypothetical protein
MHNVRHKSWSRFHRILHLVSSQSQHGV